ncbi:MAG: hypothetical protein ACJAYC_002587 [Halieaceae bacterium]|jgi:hypothetical protein
MASPDATEPVQAQICLLSHFRRVLCTVQFIGQILFQWHAVGGDKVFEKCVFFISHR